MIPVNLDRFDLDLERLRGSRDAAVDKMAGSLKRRGQLTPVIVTERGDRYLLVDGFKRYRAAEKLRSASLNVVVIQADSKQAKAMLYLLNRPGGFSMIQEALLVKELIEIDGLTRSEAGLLVDRHKSWISRRLDMVRRLSPEVIDALLLELIPPGVGSSLARIPPCNQPDFAAAIQVHRLTPSEIRRLADFYCKAPDPDMKQMILGSPERALGIVQQEMKTVPPEKIIFKIIAMIETIQNATIYAEGREKLQKVKSILNEILMKKEET